MSNRVVADLRKNYKVDEYFYPNISMDIDLPQGLEGEVNSVMQVLERNGFEGTSGNIFHTMELKRNLLTKYSGRVEGKRIIDEYNKILHKKEPIGSIVPPEYFLVNGLIVVFLFVIARFAGSFADEAGKLTAHKLFDRGNARKQLMKELNVDASEYNLLSDEIAIIIKEDSKFIEALRMELKKKAKN